MLKTVRRWQRDRSGSTSIMFAFAGAALCIALGVAVDYTSMSSRAITLQDMSDGAVIAAALSGETTEAELETYVNTYVQARTSERVDIDLSVASGRIDLTLEQPYDLMILGGFMDGKDGSDDYMLMAKSAAPMVGAPQIDMALVVDTTESMEGDKIKALENSANKLIDKLKKADRSEDKDGVRLSLVPFAEYVRLDTGLRSANWINVPPDKDITWSSLDEEASTNCRRESVGETMATVCDTYVYVDKTDFMSWHGCMGSRPYDRHLYPEFATYRMEGIVGHSSCGADYNQLLPLTTDLKSIKDAAKDLSVQGKTYLPAGLIWGWRTLDPAEPFTEASARPKARRVLVLMSDGSNTTHLSDKNEHDARYHWGDSDESISKPIADQLTLQMCSTIKADNIQIITIAFQIDDADTRSMLQSCASDPGKFYNVEEIKNLERAFQRIGEGLTEVRLLPT